MKKLYAIFLATMIASVGSFALLWLISPDVEKEKTISSQGIRLVGSAVFYKIEDTTKPRTLRVGDLLIGRDEQVYRVNELRRSQDNAIYVVVSWKSLIKYTSYEEYMSQPYANYKIYELNAFIFNKSIITNDDVQLFYKNFSMDLNEIHTPHSRYSTQSNPTPPSALKKSKFNELEVRVTGSLSEPADIDPMDKEMLGKLKKTD